MNVWLLGWVQQLIVEKTPKATRGLSGNKGSRPLRPRDSWKYFSTYSRMKPAQDKNRKGSFLAYNYEKTYPPPDSSQIFCHPSTVRGGLLFPTVS